MLLYHAHHVRKFQHVDVIRRCDRINVKSFLSCGGYTSVPLFFVEDSIFLISEYCRATSHTDMRYIKVNIVIKYNRTYVTHNVRSVIYKLEKLQDEKSR